MRALVAALAVVLVVSAPLRADDEPAPAPLKVTEADFATFVKLRRADAVFSEHKFRTRDAAKLKKREEARDKTWKESGWDRERFDAARTVIEEVVMLLNDEKGENAAEAKESLKERDATTVATVRAHLKELTDFDAEQRRVEAQVKEDNLAPAPDPKEVDGTWVFDPEKTVDRMTKGALKGEERTKVLDKLKGNLSSYTFTGGKTFACVEEKSGSKSETKGSYRLDGRKLFLKGEKGEKETELEIASEDGCLVIGSGFAQGVYTKKK